MRPPAAALMIAMAAAQPAAAHHSLSAYDHANPTTLEGVVAEFRFVNPHPILVVRVGQTRWAMEMDNRRELVAVGMDEQTFRPGDRVKVTGNPSRAETTAMYVRRLERPRDGLVYEQVGFSPRLSLGGG